MTQPLLSIGMIVKNEERSLEKCLKALTPLRQAIPCELVIADTGSTDKTKEIATKYADTVFDFKWVNDFSAARNAVIEKCCGKWFLTLDADEYLSPNIDELLNFLTGSLSDKKITASVVIRNHKKIDMTGLYNDFNAIRMVRLDTGRRYKGAIHESLELKSIEECQVLTNTLFDHDGYAEISFEQALEKEKRNLILLEEEFNKNPKNIKCVLQCLESSSKQPEKRRYFTEYAIKLLKEKDISNPQWDVFAPTCAYQATVYADSDEMLDLLEWYNWVFETFPDSDKILIDVKYAHTIRLYIEKDYVATIKAGKEYLKSLTKYKNSKKQVSILTFINPITRIHAIHENTINIIIANSMLNINKVSEAIKILEKINLTTSDEKIIKTWLDSVIMVEKTAIKKIIENSITELFKNYKNNTLQEPELYDFTISAIQSIFSCKNETPDAYNLFSEVPGTIGLSAKICSAKTKDEAQKYINQIENWDEFMPLALKQALLLKADLPKEFYTMSSSRLELLTNNLSKVTEEIANVIINHYCSEESLKEFPQISFIFNLLSNSLFNNTELNKELRLVLIDKFLLVADMFLNTCYNPDLLCVEMCIGFLPENHLFAWYLIKATKEKESNPLEYIKTLRIALQKVPQAKQIVEFLIEEFKNEEELKRQEKIKTASPELLAMAEQLKTMLKAFPENSPELLAIKQSPVYKQVAFLIED